MNSNTKIINANKHLFPNIKIVNIVSLSGDNSESSQQQIGICKLSKISGFKIEEISRWLRPADEMIKYYGVLIQNSNECKNLVNELQLIINIINNNDPLIIKKIIENEDDIYIDEVQEQRQLAEMQIELEDSKVKLEQLINQCNESLRVFNDKYNINLEFIPEINSSLSAENYVLQLLNYTNTLINQINKENISLNLNIDPEHDLAILNVIKAMELPGEYDYVTSSWCIIHTADPIKTFCQAFNILKPGTGIIHADGFFLNILHNDVETKLYSNADDNIETYKRTGREEMLELLHNFEIPYIIDTQVVASRRICGYVVNQPSTKELSIKFNYEGMHFVPDQLYMQIDSHRIIKIITTNDWIDISQLNDPEYFRQKKESSFKDFYTTLRSGKVIKLFGSNNFVSIETALLMAKLKYEGLCVGKFYFSTCDDQEQALDEKFEQLAKLINREFQNESLEQHTLRDLLIQYRAYDTAKNGIVDDVAKIIEIYPDCINYFTLLATIQNDSVDSFELILKHLYKKTENIHYFLDDVIKEKAVEQKAKKILKIINNDDFLNKIIIDSDHNVNLIIMGETFIEDRVSDEDFL